MEKNIMKRGKWSTDYNCPSCGGRWYYYRVKTDTFLCRSCGTVFVMDLSDGRTYRVNLDES